VNGSAWLTAPGLSRGKGCSYGFAPLEPPSQAREALSLRCRSLVFSNLTALFMNFLDAVADLHRHFRDHSSLFVSLSFVLPVCPLWVANSELRELRTGYHLRALLTVDCNQYEELANRTTNDGQRTMDHERLTKDKKTPDSIISQANETVETGETGETLFYIASGIRLLACEQKRTISLFSKKCYFSEQFIKMEMERTVATLSKTPPTILPPSITHPGDAEAGVRAFDLPGFF
jgi:hypothetical protein